jgi:hypothetical protein
VTTPELDDTMFGADDLVRGVLRELEREYANAPKRGDRQARLGPFPLVTVPSAVEGS